jgi:hypothetical protein
VATALSDGDFRESRIAAAVYRSDWFRQPPNPGPLAAHREHRPRPPSGQGRALFGRLWSLRRRSASSASSGIIRSQNRRWNRAELKYRLLFVTSDYLRLTVAATNASDHSVPGNHQALAVPQVPDGTGNV